MPPVPSTPPATRGALGRALARAALRVPLTVKIAGANALVVLVAVAAVGSAARPGTGGLRHVAVPAAALLVGVLVNVLLVRTALGPLRELERTAARVVGGDLGARVPASPVADPDMARVGAALNALLDALGAERARVRALAAEVIRSSDADRARVARELHDSTAQTLAALTLQAGSAARRLVSGGDDGLAEQLTTVRDLSVDALEEVRALSQTVHPRVLEDLGLRAALEELAQACGAEHGARVEVAADGDAGRLAPALSATIYRIAEQALADAAAHARDGRIVVRLTVTSTRASLEIADDGRALAADGDGERRPGVGLFVMQERAALLDGVVRVERASGRGTRVAAEFPLLPPAAGSGPHPETA